MNKNDSILVTGGRGFVGKNLIGELKRLGFKDVSTPAKDCDLRIQDDVKYLFSITEPKYIFHLAARVGGISANLSDPYKFLFENISIQTNVINEAIKFGVEKFLNLGSSCIYPKDYPNQPLKEEYLLDGKLEPTNEGYALAKIVGLKMAEYANKQSNTKFISLMPCNLYGPGDHFDLQTSHALSATILKIYNAIENKQIIVNVWGNGQQKREWLYIDDLIDCMIWSMNNIDKTDTFLNVGTGVDIAMNDLTEEVISAFFELYDREYKYEIKIENDLSKPNGMMKKCLDVSKINSLGWKSEIDLDEGLKRTIQWFLENYGN